MNKNLLKKIFPLIAVLLLTPWPVAYAHTNDVEAVAGQDAVRIEVADPSATPNWQVFGRAIGGVEKPGTLFYIDATENPTDIKGTLYITNTNDLVRGYSYLILNVGLYVETETGEWEEATWVNGEIAPEQFITLQNGRVSFSLSGYARYKVTIDEGSFKANPVRDDASVSPQFYLTVD